MHIYLLLLKYIIILRYFIKDSKQVLRKRYIKIVKLLVVHDSNINHANQFGETALALANKNRHTEIARIIKKINYLKKVNLLYSEQITTIINHLLTKQLDNNKVKNDKKTKEIYQINNDNEQKIINIIDNYEFNLQQKIKYNNFNFINDYLKKEFINNLKFKKENYDLLHIAVLNNCQQLITYLITKWPININFKDNLGNSAWNYACLLLQKENALTIKKDNQLTNEDKTFLQKITPLAKGWSSIEKKEINKIASENRKNIFDYYTSPIAKINDIVAPKTF